MLLLPLLALLAGPAHAADPVPDAVRAAAASHPEVHALEQRAEALRAEGRAAAVWPDPVASVEASNLPVDRLDLSSHPMSGVQLMLRQALPVVGRLRAAREARTAGVDALERQAGEHAPARVEAALRGAWWRWVRARSLLHVLETHIERLDRLESAVRARYETGGAGQGELLQVALRRDRLRDEQGDLRRDAEAALDTLEGLAGAPVEPGPLPTPVPVRPAPDTPDAWLALARADSDAATRLDGALAQAQGAADLARAAARPEPSVWAGYRIRTVETATDAGVDFVGAGVSVPLPLASARRAAHGIDAAEARRDASQADFDAWLRQAEADLRAAHTAWVRAVERARARRQALLPDARRALDATLSDFRVGRADFAALITAEVTVLDLEREALVAATETWLQAARVQGLLAVPDDTLGAPP